MENSKRTGQHGSRKFYDLQEIPSDHKSSKSQKCDPADGNPVSDLFQYVSENVIGRNKVFSGPYGMRKVIYTDYTASGKSLAFIEKYILDEVLPDYGNTHTTTTVTSLQTTLFRHEARDIVRNAVNASEHDAVIFIGSGSTGAVHKLIQALQLNEPPVVFVGPFEHHSNLLPWMELGGTIIRIRETSQGLVDLEHLKQELAHWRKSDKELIGCFSAASNVTGILTDTDKVTCLLHQYGALAFWDYATAAPYVNIDMNPVAESGDTLLYQKDAIFFSCHKFVGGVQTPGLLIAKKKLFRNLVPSQCGGGSVFFVRREGHRYLQEAEMREEGGTPAIVESIRAGLVLQLKEAISAEVIMQREKFLCQKALKRWKSCENLVILGSTSVPRLPIFSFLIKHPTSGLYLHHNFTCALLNDLFGIQARGGCACAGPYAQDLLGISEDMAEKIENMLMEDSRLDRVHLRRYAEYSENEILRPGFTRLNLPFFMDDETIDFIIDAVAMVSENGWRMLPHYTFKPETGEWRHRSHQVFKDRKWLGFINYKEGMMKYREPPENSKGCLPENLQRCLEEGEKILKDQRKTQFHISDQTVMFNDEAKSLRWFLLPSEVLIAKQNIKHSYHKSPFHPVPYPATSKPIESGLYNYVPVHKKDVVLPGLSYRGQTSSLSKPDLSTALSVDKKGPETFITGFRSQYLHGFHDEGPKADCDDSITQEQRKAGCVEMGKQETRMEFDENPSIPESNISKDMIVEKDISDSHPHNPSESKKPKLEVEPKKSVVCLDGACFTKRLVNKADMEHEPKVKVKWHAPPTKIFKPFLSGVEEFSMFKDGDRVLVCLSGGKDSLSLLHCMRQYQFYAKKKGISFELGAVTVDPQTSAYDPSPLKNYLKQLNVPYFYEEQPILEAAANLNYEVASICSFCSRLKRGRIYHAARREQYNVLALGQHLDDLAESFLMSIFHNGLLRTMKAHYTVEDGDLRVVRPFVYVREKDLRQFAEEKSLPVISENCPACFEAPKERHRMKQLLASQEVIFPRLFHSLQAALRPIMAINKTGVSAKTILNLLENDTLEDEDM